MILANDISQWLACEVTRFHANIFVWANSVNDSKQVHKSMLQQISDKGMIMYDNADND